jgi:hypothetical protein
MFSNARIGDKVILVHGSSRRVEKIRNITAKRRDIQVTHSTHYYRERDGRMKGRYGYFPPHLEIWKQETEDVINAAAEKARLIRCIENSTEYTKLKELSNEQLNAIVDALTETVEIGKHESKK